jgi:putative addiction module component (TIGR02574 family)
MSALVLADLTADKRLDLIAELWDSLGESVVPVSPAQRAELDRRLETEETQPSRSWAAVEGTLRRRLG